jgi:single-strand DNA-binding protein
MNSVKLAGRLGKDPEVKQFENSKLLSFSLATEENYRKSDGEPASRTEWHIVKAWGKLAEKMESVLKKGTFVSLEGRLTTNSYTDKAGVKKYSTEIIANTIEEGQPG